MGAPKVCVVILHWKHLPETLACLQSLELLDYPNRQTVVVDNGAPAGDADILSGLDGIELVRNQENLGFTGGANAGIARSLELGADYVWLLNSDATTEPDVLSKLVSMAETDDMIGLVSPVIHDTIARDVPEFCVGLFDQRARTISETANPDTARAWQAQHPTHIFVPGTALLIRRSLIDKIGFLDDRFFAYVEDLDYSLRSAAAGYRNVAVLDAIIYHRFKRPVQEPGTSPPYLHYLITRNKLLLWKKLPGPTLRPRATVWFLLERLRQIERMIQYPASVDALVSGLWDGIRGIGGPYNPSRHSPRLLMWAVGKHPAFWIRMIEWKRPRFRWFQRTT